MYFLYTQLFPQSCMIVSTHKLGIKVENVSIYKIPNQSKILIVNIN